MSKFFVKLFSTGYLKRSFSSSRYHPIHAKRLYLLRKEAICGYSKLVSMSLPHILKTHAYIHRRTRGVREKPRAAVSPPPQ